MSYDKQGNKINPNTEERADSPLSKFIRDTSFDNESCPVCGFYCLGNGGLGCIDKPKLTGLQESA
jgi:hypothetical protein